MLFILSLCCGVLRPAVYHVFVLMLCSGVLRPPVIIHYYICCGVLGPPVWSPEASGLAQLERSSFVFSYALNAIDGSPQAILDGSNYPAASL